MHRYRFTNPRLWNRLGVFLALLLWIVQPSAAQETSPAAEPTPKPDRAQLEAQFSETNARRNAAAAATKERIEAAQRAMQIASDIAWTEFDAGRFAEASNWFARSAQLKKDHNAASRGYWEDYLRNDAAKLEEQLGARIDEWKAKLATAPEAEKEGIRGAIHSLEQTRYIMRYNAITMLQTVARESHDTTSLLKYCEDALAIKRLELAYLESAVSSPKDIYKKKVEIAGAIENVASAQASLTMFDVAEKNYLQALEIRRSLPEELAERKVESTLADMGWMYLNKIGDYKKAREHYEQAVASTEASAEARKKALTEDPYPPALKAHMTPEQLAEHEKGLAQTRALMIALDTLSYARALQELGSAIHEAGDLKTAATYYQRGIDVAETLPKGGGMGMFDLIRAQVRARGLSDLAQLHANSGDLELALKELNEAVAIKRAIGVDESTANSLLQIADMEFGKGEMERAKNNVEQARQIFAGAQHLGSVVSATRFLAVIEREENRLDEAASRAEEALLLARKSGNLGLISSCARTFASIRLHQKKLDEAAPLIEEARAADAKTGSVNDRITTLGFAGELLELKGENEKALEAYQEAVKLLESVRSTAASEEAFSEVKENYRPYERIVRVLIKLNRATEAFDYLNRAKSKKLQDSMRLSSVKSGDKATQELLDRATDLKTRGETATAQLRTEEARPEAERDKAKIENLKQVVASTEGEYRRVFEQIKSANPNWEKFMTVNPKSLKATQRGIPAGVMLVQYAPLGEQLYVFLVSKENLKIVIAPAKPEELWKKIKTVRKQITSGESGAPLTKNLTALYDLLIAPIETELEPIKTIAFIPNQLLFYLPMQALAKKQPDGALRYLIEDKQIVYLTAADVMNVVQPPDEEKSTGGMIAFGNPTGANLPASEEEVKAIAQVYPATDVLAGAQVTKGAINAEDRLNKRIVHFATHGILNASTPADSYIQLAAGGGPEQERLTVGEVWDLPLKKVALVTLSACESALGEKEPDGGEITTLAEAFSSAGATTVLASQWSVGDESTKELMVEFYSQLAGGASKAAALQAAAVKLLKNPKFARPLYWAPFVLMGDWR